MKTPKPPIHSELAKVEIGPQMTKTPTARQMPAKSGMPNLFISHTASREKDNGTKPVYIITYFNNKRLRFHTGVEVLPKDWDDRKKIVRKSEKRFASMNLMIRDAVAKINDLYVKYTLAGVKLTAERLKEDYEKPEYVFDFIEFMQSAIDERKGVVADSTINQHNGILSKLKAYKPRILSDQLSDEFFDGYNKHLKTKLKNIQNTRHGNFKTIISYLHIALERGMISKMPIKKNPVNPADPKVIFLTEGEFVAMIDLYRKGTLSKSLQSVLRWFLFCCSTGLRISDVRSITMDDIIGDLLILMPYKTINVTRRTVKIPLMDFAKQLIQDEGDVHIDNLVFNCISEQKMRDYIKTIKNRLGITHPVPWHSSRHTFATIFLRNTHNMAALQKILGHASIKQTMGYAHTMTEDVQEAMKFQNKF